MSAAVISPLIEWSELVGLARKALRNADCCDANCSFNDSNFQNNLTRFVPKKLKLSIATSVFCGSIGRSELGQEAWASMICFFP
jgi:hypothetical protein